MFSRRESNTVKMITELTICPMCKSTDIKKVIWKAPGYAHRGETRKSLDKFGIGCLIEFVCQKCGFKHTEN